MEYILGVNKELGEKQFLTFREYRELYNIPLTASDFVPSKGACDPDFFSPEPKVPKHLFDHDVAERIEELLTKCTEVVTPWGYFARKREMNEYKVPADEFQKLTGVDVWDIITLARKVREENL